MAMIEERAKQYVRRIWAGGSRDWGTNKQWTSQDFIAGANSEHKILTRWRDPNTPPAHSNEILIKYYRGTGGGEFHIIGCYYNGKWKTPLNILDETYDKILGWREIHE